VDEHKHQRLEILRGSIVEPNCPHDWCRIKNSVKWSGPAEKGVLINPNFERIPFNPPVFSGKQDEL
jgi:hypothetical protein